MTLDDELRIFASPYSPPNAKGTGTQSAGAQRPKAGSATGSPQVTAVSSERLSSPSDDSKAGKQPSTSVYTKSERVPLGVKLRQQAADLGLKPGSPRWRAYVLGTTAKAAKRKRRKEAPHV